MKIVKDKQEPLKSKNNKMMDLGDEVIVIECDVFDTQQKSQLAKETISYKRKMHEPIKIQNDVASVSNKRQVALKELGQNKETLVITQQVNIKKDSLQCVININGKFNDANRIVDLTELSEKDSPSKGIRSESKEKNKKRSNSKKVNKAIDKSHVKNEKDNNIYIEKILPKCNRINCQHYLRNWRAENYKSNVAARKANFSTCRKYKPGSAKLTRLKKRKSTKLSPISSSPLREEFNSYDGELAYYEDISSEDDFSFLLNEKLDTLIKRTKDRDRKLTNTQVNQDKNHNDTDTKPGAVKIDNNNYIQSVLSVKPKCLIKDVPKDIPNEIPVIAVSNLVQDSKIKDP